MFLTMMAGFAELERNLIAERTATALQHKKSHREVYGTTPLGFDREGDKLIENNDEQALLEEIKAMRTAGLSLHKIAAALNDQGIQGKKGGMWYASTVKYLLDNNLYEEVA